MNARRHGSPEPTAASVVVAIPARYASTRLPGKPLVELGGRTMIEWVVRRAAAAEHVDRVVVLTDDERIVATVRAFGGEVEMTPEHCRSGTDRIAWAARNWQADAIINVQGDEPLLDPRAVDQVARHLREHSDEPMVTLAHRIDEGDRTDPSKVKVVTDLSGRALYFSRADIPNQQGGAGAASCWQHVGIYGYRRDTLLRLATLEATPLERSESLEQLRALEHGIPIRVLVTEHRSFGVDTPADVERADALLHAEPVQTSG